MLSNREAHLVGEIFEESEKALSWTAEKDEQSFLRDEPLVYATEKAIQNTVEACIQLEGKLDTGRFEALFPNYTLRAVKKIGNSLRHNYAGVTATEVYATIGDFVGPIHLRASELLDQHRALHGDR
ncbi:HepT-like ribonuclease domain-containing protein [Henriciella sp. AS95]|uniref:HepT-like ribonuclease domain-containing protein n=1 Tax=Henriciella sp. AS95 TaxID=3135782 RepID=UPI0031817C93